jgi:hypothetical protein
MVIKIWIVSTGQACPLGTPWGVGSWPLGPTSDYVMNNITTLITIYLMVIKIWIVSSSQSCPLGTLEIGHLPEIHKLTFMHAQTRPEQATLYVLWNAWATMQSEDGGHVFVWSPCTTVSRFDEGFDTWRAQDYVSSSKTAEHFNRSRGIVSTADMINGNKIFIGDTNQRRGKKCRWRNF